MKDYYQKMIKINKQRKAELIAEIAGATDPTQKQRKEIELKRIKVEIMNWLEGLSRVENAA